jgi:hypothetical protein
MHAHIHARTHTCSHTRKHAPTQEVDTANHVWANYFLAAYKVKRLGQGSGVFTTIKP